uniref:SHSP domain-containing protein n=1 Tax=Setaria italica TaxID=4555 RepID=K3ZE33_SETIT
MEARKRKEPCPCPNMDVSSCRRASPSFTLLPPWRFGRRAVRRRLRRRLWTAAARELEDFDPVVEWKLAGEVDLVEISLPGFRKDQVRVQVENHGVLRATGDRPARGGRWARFKKDLRLPDNCDADAVRARFEGEKLIITLMAASPGTPGPPRWPPAAYSGPSPPKPSPPLPPPPRHPPPPPSRPPPPPPRPAPAKPTIHDQTKPTTAEPKPSPSPPPHGTPAAVPGPIMPGRAISVSPPSPAPLPPYRAEEAPEKQLQGATSPAALARHHGEAVPRKPLQEAKVPEEDGSVSRALPETKKKSKKRTGGEVRGKVEEDRTAPGKNQAQAAMTTMAPPPEPCKAAAGEHCCGGGRARGDRLVGVAQPWQLSYL